MAESYLQGLLFIGVFSYCVIFYALSENNIGQFNVTASSGTAKSADF